MANRRAIKQLITRIGKTSVNDILDGVRDFMGTIGDVPLWQDTDMLRDNYALMMKYMREGIKDSSRKFVLQNMKQRCYQIVSDSLVWDDRKNNPIIGQAWRTVTKNSTILEITNIQDNLEKYTSDITMTELLGEEQRKAETERITDEHYTFMNLLFCNILCSTQWSKGESETYATLLTKPTISPDDQALIVSAITISAFEYFDLGKLATLLDTYLCIEADLAVRQRAFVGFALCLNDTIDIYRKEQRLLIDKLFAADSEAANNLLTLQKQIIFCIDVSNDSEIISKEIIPNLIKNNPNISITPEGIKEKDDDALRDILDPAANEREMEEMEKTMEEMSSMMKNGADIYFTGFSQMKRFPFFSNISNWFRPFSPSHPLLRSIPDEILNSQMMATMREGMPFCESDKYSFALTLTQTLYSMPENIREIMLDGKMGLAGTGMDMLHSPLYIRRTYLQDLYRFYRLFPGLENNLIDIFSKDKLMRNNANGYTRTFFAASSLFCTTALRERYVDLIMFLKKKGTHFDAALEYLVALVDSNSVDEKFIRFVITHQMNKNDYMTNITLSTKLMMLHHTFPNNRWYTKNLAKVEFRLHDYASALALFTELLEEGKEDVSLLINIATCHMYNHNPEEAYKILLPLTFNHENDERVEKATAWCNLLLGKVEEGYAYYSTICASKDGEGYDSEDILNAGYSAWIAGKMDEALRMFRIYVKKESFETLKIDMKKTQVLPRNLIFDEDCELMLDIIRTE